MSVWLNKRLCKRNSCSCYMTVTQSTMDSSVYWQIETRQSFQRHGVRANSDHAACPVSLMVVLYKYTLISDSLTKCITIKLLNWLFQWAGDGFRMRDKSSQRCILPCKYVFNCVRIWSLDKSVCLKIIFLISESKHMLWVLTETVLLSI